MTDTDLINWLEEQYGCGLISDDFGHWAVSGSGMQNMPLTTPADIDTTFFVEAAEWKDSIREAIKAARDNWESEDGGDASEQ